MVLICNFFLLCATIVLLSTCGLFSPPKGSFSVSGTVSGLLSGNSLVLDLNGDETLTVAQNGSFTFPSKVEEGAEYLVTIKTQPTGQTAVISGGLDVMPAKPVTGITVEVTTNTYTVGGSVTGHPGTGDLILLLNGANDLSLTSDGAFEFAQEVAHNENYAVTVASEPAGYMATIDNGSGVISAADVSNVVITCMERTYTVGGTVNGLASGDTVSLTLNGGDPLTISSDGSFEFPETLNDNVTYNVALDTGPAGKQVVLNNETGLISGADIIDVSVQVATQLSDITSNQALQPGIYTIADFDQIDVYADLQVFPGTTFVFGSGSSMLVDPAGSLNAVGTETDPIVFTADDQTPGYWRGLGFYDSNSSSNVLDHVIIEYGGSSTHPYADTTANLALCTNNLTCSVSVSNSTFRYATGAGVFVDDAGNLPVFTGNTMTGNTSGAAYAFIDDVRFFGSDNSYSGNDADVFLVDRGYNMGTSQNWQDLGVPYFIFDTSTSATIDTALTLEPGVEIQVAQGTRVTIGSVGSLTAVGTEAEPILFTGSSAQPGWWDGLYFYDSDNTANQLSWVTVEYGGGAVLSYADVAAGLLLATNNDVCQISIDNCTFQHNGGYGICFSRDSVLSGFSSNVITDNADGAIYMYASVAGELDTATNYTGNGNDRVFVDTQYNVTAAQTWLDIGVPYVLGEAGTYLTVLAHLTLEPGVEMQFGSNAGLYISNTGVLTAEGTTTDQIIFTGLEKSSGYWRGINFYDTPGPSNILDNVIVEYAGSTAWNYTNSTQANVSVSSNNDPCSVEVRNSVIRNGNGVGIWIDAAAGYNTDIADVGVNTYTANVGADVLIE